MSRWELRARRPSQALRWIKIVPLLLLGAATFAAAQPTRIFHAVTTNMEPTVLKGAVVVISPDYYSSRAPSRGDVVMMIAARDQHEHLVRIIGLPGERIELRGGQLYIDDREVPRRRIEDYIYHFEESLPAETLEQYIESLPGANGEAREHRIVKESDSGPLNDTKVFAVPAGQYFVLGDNRDNSVDSRTSLGFVPLDAIVGKAISQGVGEDIE